LLNRVEISIFTLYNSCKLRFFRKRIYVWGFQKQKNLFAVKNARYTGLVRPSGIEEKKTNRTFAVRLVTTIKDVGFLS